MVIRMKAPREEALIQTFSVSALAPNGEAFLLITPFGGIRTTDHCGNPQRY
jgi:hypothetical protein